MAIFVVNPQYFQTIPNIQKKITVGINRISDTRTKNDLVIAINPYDIPHVIHGSHIYIYNMTYILHYIII